MGAKISRDVKDGVNIIRIQGVKKLHIPPDNRPDTGGFSKSPQKTFNQYVKTLLNSHSVGGSEPLNRPRSFN